MSDSADRGSDEQRGEVLDMLRSLMADGRNDDVVSLVSKLVANNTELAERAARSDTLAVRVVELEKQLEKLLARVKKSETVSTAQLVLWADAIRRGEAGDVLAEGDPRADANEKLRDKSGLDDEQEPETKPPPERPTGRKPAPKDMRRVENPIAVPPGERACPRCGKERTCIGHETTETIDLIPAQVIVRHDSHSPPSDARVAATSSAASSTLSLTGTRRVEGEVLSTACSAATCSAAAHGIGRRNHLRSRSKKPCLNLDEVCEAMRSPYGCARICASIRSARSVIGMRSRTSNPSRYDRGRASRRATVCSG